MKTRAQDARGRRSSAPPQSPPWARRDAAPRQAPPPAAGPERPRFPAERLHSLPCTLRMALLVAPVQRRGPAVAGRLIEHRIAPRRLAEGFGVGLLLDVEGVKAGAQHEHELVAQHLAGSAQLALIAVALTQQA